MPKIAVNIPCERVATFEAFDLLNYRLPPSLAVRVRASAGAIKVLAESKLRVPEDVVIVGYDNTDICIGLTPTLTTVDYHAEEVGRCLAGELLALIEGKVSSIQKAIQPFLVERESHGPNGKPEV